MWMFFDITLGHYKHVHQFMNDMIMELWFKNWEQDGNDALRVCVPECGTDYYKVKWHGTELWQQRRRYEDNTHVAWKRLHWFP